MFANGRQGCETLEEREGMAGARERWTSGREATWPGADPDGAQSLFSRRKVVGQARQISPSAVSTSRRPAFAQNRLVSRQSNHGLRLRAHHDYVSDERKAQLFDASNLSAAKTF
jgi:hypothetical protein